MGEKVYEMIFLSILLIGLYHSKKNVIKTEVKKTQTDESYINEIIENKNKLQVKNEISRSTYKKVGEYLLSNLTYEYTFKERMTK